MLHPTGPKLVDCLTQALDRRRLSNGRLLRDILDVVPGLDDSLSPQPICNSPLRVLSTKSVFHLFKERLLVRADGADILLVGRLRNLPTAGHMLLDGGECFPQDFFFNDPASTE